MSDQIFFNASMPSSRPADYYLGYMDGCVFIDFNTIGADKVCLKRISFDGYGCCDLGDRAIPLSSEDSKLFREIVRDNITDQGMLLIIIKKAIEINRKNIWEEALTEYKLI